MLSRTQGHWSLWFSGYGWSARRQGDIYHSACGRCPWSMASTPDHSPLKTRQSNKDNLSVCWKLQKRCNQVATTAECWSQRWSLFDPRFQRGARQKKLENHCYNVLWLKVSTKCHMAEWREEAEKDRQGSRWDMGSHYTHYIQNVTLWHKHYIYIS